MLCEDRNCRAPATHTTHITEKGVICNRHFSTTVHFVFSFDEDFAGRKTGGVSTRPLTAL